MRVGCCKRKQDPGLRRRFWFMCRSGGVNMKVEGRGKGERKGREEMVEGRRKREDTEERRMVRRRKR